MNANQYNPSNHKKIVLASEINQIPNGMEGEFLGREVYSQRKHGNVNSFVQQFLTSHLASIESDSNQALVILLSRQSLTAFKHSSMKPSSTRKPL